MANWDDLRTTVRAAAKEGVVAADIKPVIGDDYYLANNKRALQAVDAHNDKWLRQFHAKIDALLAPLQQLMGKLVVMMVKQDAAQPTAAAPRKPSLASRALRWLYADCISSIWKYLAYFVAVLSLVFALCQWYQNRRLTQLAKEYAIVRAFCEVSPRSAAILNRIDSIMATDDLDRVYQLATQRDD